MEQRIIELEKLLAYQGNAIDDINEILRSQQKTIEALERELRTVTEKMTAEPLVKPIEDEEPPPHY